MVSRLAPKASKSPLPKSRKNTVSTADMIKMAKHEDIDSTTLAELEAQEPMLTPDFRKAIERNKEEVKEMLGSEIVLRYYYQRGQAAYQIRFDDELRRALKELR